MKIKFITCIYSNLAGSIFGGRSSRGGHYRWSLLSLLKMTNADFVCYTSSEEYDSLVEFFYRRHSIDQEKFKIKIFDLKTSVFYEKLNFIKQKNIKFYTEWDRSLDIQYNKFFWFDMEDKTYDYYYWIDAGLSHCGLLPNKWLPYKDVESCWYHSDIFDNNFLSNLINYTDEKLFIIAKDNVRNYWSGTVDQKYYDTFDMSYHIIGGLFGGKKDIFVEFVEKFKYYLNLMLENGETPSEENILSLMNVNHSDVFVRKYFDTWWCMDNAPSGTSEEYFEKNKSFYKVLEEIINNE